MYSKRAVFLLYGLTLALSACHPGGASHSVRTVPAAPPQASANSAPTAQTEPESAMGPGSSGGGDTDAGEFVLYAHNLAEWLTYDMSFPEINKVQLKQLVTTLEKSMDGTEKAKVTFTKDPVQDPHGTPKMARYNRADTSILVNRDYWQGLKHEERYELVGMELSGLLGVTTRYLKAAQIAQNIDAIEGTDWTHALVVEKVRDALTQETGPLKGAKAALLKAIQNEADGNASSNSVPTDVNLDQSRFSVDEVSSDQDHGSRFTSRFLVRIQTSYDTNHGEQSHISLVVAVDLEVDFPELDNGSETQPKKTVTINSWKVMTADDELQAMGLTVPTSSTRD